jgi:hypothetical protein
MGAEIEKRVYDQWPNTVVSAQAETYLVTLT